jgi:dipeptidyl aminopeptidase/acylaminoacyl peptidase
VTSGATPHPRRLWRSPVSAATVASAGLRYEGLQIDGDNAYWVEGRPAEGGRCVIVRRDVRGASPAQDLLAPPFSARTFVHEYGGGALLAAGSHVVFCNGSDGRLYHLGDGDAPVPLTPELEGVRYADMAYDGAGEALFCVVEDHRGASVVNTVARIAVDGGEPVTVTRGNDFYAAPRVSPEGTRICWLTWNQPLMPWEGTELWCARLDGDGVPHEPEKVAGGTQESVFQPSWSPDSTLHFISDRTGWWNLYRWDGRETFALAPMQAECGRPHWQFGMATYGFLENDRIALCACHRGVWRLHVLDTGSGALEDRDELPYTSLGPWFATSRDSVVTLAGGPRDPAAIVRVDASAGASSALSADTGERIDASVLSEPEHIEFPGHAGATAHAWYYRPRNDSSQAEPGTLPPLLVHAHGGPTSATSSALSASVQYWTSRGVAFLDVDYGGSTGYGRAYRKRLDRASGVVDVGDCVAGGRHLAHRGDVDAARLFIDGGSAGGYIVLCAMVFHDVFAAGASLYGIGDLASLFAETHKFEAHYEAPYPEDPDELYARSPVHFVDRVRKPLLILQGLDDPIVPADQSAHMYDALSLRGVPCAYVTFEGEGHGFRNAENIERALTAETYFFCRVSGIEPPDDAPPIPIANL